MGESYFVEIFEIGLSHIFLKKMTEVFFLEACQIGNFVEGYGGVKVVIRVIHDQLQGVKVLCMLPYVGVGNGSRKIMVQLIKHLEYQTVKAQYFSLRIDLKNNLHFFYNIYELHNLSV